MSRVTLQNRRKYRKIFSDTVNVCLDSLKKDEHYYVSRSGCGQSISPLAARLSIKLAGCMKEIIKEIELEIFDDPVIKLDNDDSFIADDNDESEMDDVINNSDQEDNKYNLHRRLDPLLNVLIEENHSHSLIDSSTNENITPRDPGISVDQNISDMPSESPATETSSVKTFKNKPTIPTRFVKKSNCPKAIPLRKLVKFSKDKGKQTVSKPADESSLSTANDHVVIETNSSQINPEHIIPHVIIMRQQSPSKSMSEQSVMKKVDANVSKSLYTAESDSDNDDNITLVINKKTNNAIKQKQADNELEEFSPNDSDNDTTITQGSPKQRLTRLVSQSSSECSPRKQPVRVSRLSSKCSPQKQPVRVTRSSVKLMKPVIDYNLSSSPSESDKTSSDKSSDESEVLSTTTNSNSVKRRARKEGNKKVVTKKTLSQTTIHHPTWTLRRANKRNGYNSKTDIQEMKWSQRRADTDKLNELVYEKCVELKNKNFQITDGKIHHIATQIIEQNLPKNFHISRNNWLNEFLNKYNISGRPLDRII